jgi:hypothetical protein
MMFGLLWYNKERKKESREGVGTLWMIPSIMDAVKVLNSAKGSGFTAFSNSQYLPRTEKI